MTASLGLDTSNYTTSAALFSGKDSRYSSSKRLLEVKPGGVGLQQSEAVFQHTRALHTVIDKAFQEFGAAKVEAIGVSVRPRDAEGSYMPCFTVGESVARSLASVLGVACHTFSHQAGHIAAALFSAGRLDLLQREFLAFHLSGGTTEAVLVTPDKSSIFTCRLAARTLDLNAGQVVDRVGKSLGLAFPAGAELDKLARQCDNAVPFRPVLKGADCCLSGLENQCAGLLQQGAEPAVIAKTLFVSLLQVIRGMLQALFEQYGGLPVVFVGGVSSNSVLREGLSPYQPVFAANGLSADNAVGAACLAWLSEFGL